MDPVKFRVAIPAADPPDNITHDYRTRARGGAQSRIMCLDVDYRHDPIFQPLSPPMVQRRPDGAP